MKPLLDVHKVFAQTFTGCESLAYALSVKLSEGNMCLDVEEYKKQLPGLLEEQQTKEYYKEPDARFWVSPEAFELQCREGKYVTRSETEVKPFVMVKGKAYLQRYFRYESEIIKNIKELGANFHIITGGPGTGKTYSVAQTLVELFTHTTGLSVALAAPTGKAAARMNESIRQFAHDPENALNETVQANLTTLKAQTLHRLLGYLPDSVFFRYNEQNPLPFDVLIVDECSMVDGAMMAKLLNAVNDRTQLYLLGDKDQLASVEAGSVFGDICRAAESEVLHDKVQVLTTSRRFDADKGIGRFSKEVIEGMAVDPVRYAKDEQVNIDTGYSADLFKEKVRIYQEYILEEDIPKALEKLNRVRFLCVTRELEHSVADTNRKIQNLLKTEINDKALFDPREGFYHNQPILITKNDYKLGIFNGDVGLIRRDGDTLYSFFESTEGQVKKIPAGYLNHYDTVFAMTIHKSQGSEFENVVVLLPEKQGKKLLTRELLYTAVTRARSKALIQASEDVLRQCVTTIVSRASGLEKRLKQE